MRSRERHRNKTSLFRNFFFQFWNHKLPGAFKANLTKKIFAEPPLYSLLFGLMLRHLEISPIKFIFSEETF